MSVPLEPIESLLMAAAFVGALTTFTIVIGIGIPFDVSVRTIATATMAFYGSFLLTRYVRDFGGDTDD